MYNTAGTDFKFLLASIAAGVVLAFFYDIFRISRRVVPTADFATGVEDLVFFSVAAVLVFGTAYCVNGGEFRPHALLGCGVGAVLYGAVIGDKAVRAGDKAVRAGVRSACAVVRVLTFPVAVTMKILHRPILVVAWYSHRGARKIGLVIGRLKHKIAVDLKNFRGLLGKK